jgi:hypothetical protein
VAGAVGRQLVCRRSPAGRHSSSGGRQAPARRMDSQGRGAGDQLPRDGTNHPGRGSRRPAPPGPVPTPARRSASHPRTVPHEGVGGRRLPGIDRHRQAVTVSQAVLVRRSIRIRAQDPLQGWAIPGPWPMASDPPPTGDGGDRRSSSPRRTRAGRLARSPGSIPRYCASMVGSIRAQPGETPGPAEKRRSRLADRRAP